MGPCGQQAYPVELTLQVPYARTDIATYSLSKKLITTINAYIRTSVTFNDPLHVQAELVSYIVFSNPLYECHFLNKAGTHMRSSLHIMVAMKAMLHGSHESNVVIKTTALPL